MKNKRNTGITLISLIITIIVLLILASISISALTQTGLFEKTKQAKQKTQEKQEEENITLSNYENSINTAISSNRDTVTISKEEYEKLTNKDYIYLTMSANQTGTNPYSKVNFDTKVYGNMPFDASTNEITLKANKKYMISAGIYETSTSSYTYTKIYNITNQINISKLGLACGSASGDGGANPIQSIYIPENDCNICVMESSGNKPVHIIASSSYFIVYEI